MLTPLQSQVAAAASLALFGGVHCAAMCGGFVAAIHVGARRGDSAPVRRILAWNLGRVAGYTGAGLLAGALGGGLFAARVLPLEITLLVLASLVLCAVGASLLGLAAWQRALEPLGAGLWRRIEPLAGRLLPLRSLPAALAAGFLWGWIPCGMVYSALPIALMAGGAAQGAMVMLGFGLGTLPNVLALHAGAARIARVPPRMARALRLLSGCVILVFAASGFAHAARIAGLRSPALQALASVCHDPAP